MIQNIDFHNLEAQKYWAPPSTWTPEKKKETTQFRIFSGEWIGARKMDGAFYKFVKNDDGSMELLGRSKGVGGDYLDKIEWVPHLKSFFDELPNGTCFLGELYFPNNEGSSKVTTIMGCLTEKAIDRQNKGDKLNYYIFDVLAFDGESYLKKTAEERFEELNIMCEAYSHKYVQYAKYYDGTELWNQLQSVLAEGGEGMVITRKESLYQPGKRPSKDCKKVKKELQETIDCFFTGKIMPPSRLYTGKEVETWKYWQNEKTGEKFINEKGYDDYLAGAPIFPITKPFFNGWAGSLEIGVLRNGKVYPLGYLSGLADEIKANPGAVKGKVIEVTAMEIMDTENKGLRHAKMLCFRPDLTYKDCTYEKVFGNE